jgi:tetratricopeptide (TPR) repeat protein
MARAVKIFISASSSDLRSFRNQVKIWLLDMGWLPVVQDHFAPDDKTVVEMLKKRISECDAVVHIIGQSYGAEPKSPLKGEARKSYTQLEAVFARKMKKRLFTVLLDEDFPYDAHEPERQELQVLQQAYRLQVATGELLYIPCSSPGDLEPEIRKLRVEVDRLHKSQYRMAVLAVAPLLIVLSLAAYFAHSVREGQLDSQKKLEEISRTMTGGGGASVQAIADIRNLLRPGVPDIDDVEKFPPEKLPGLVKRILDDLQKPGVKAADFTGSVKSVLAQAEADNGSLNFSAAASKLDAALAQAADEEANRARGRAALLAERAHVARLQLRYQEAADFYGKAASAMATDAPIARGYLLNAADSLYAQGNEFGDNAALLDAIQAYNSALMATSRDQSPQDWAAVQNALGNALAKLGERESGTDRLEAAVAAYQKALEIRTREKFPREWAATQNDLGYTLERLGERENGTTRLEAAVKVYSDVLGVLTQEKAPLDWAMAENNLGNIQLRLGEKQSGTMRLEAAIEAYNEALKARTRERVPHEWADTQNNLGLALQTLGERETGTARLEAAVAAYKEALTVRTRERLPLNWAMTENNLGLALQSLGGRETDTTHLEAAVAAFTEALKERTRERVPHEWADTQNNLGLALQALGERESGTTHLEAAVAAFSEALKENTRESDPPDWAMTEENLGSALERLGERDKTSTARLEAAVAAFTEVLKEYTRDNDPPDWAMTEDDLGNALRILGERENGTEHLEQAVAAFSQALKIRTNEQSPLDWAVSTGNQGLALMVLAKRKGDAEMAKTAAEKIEIAYTTTQGGGDKSKAAYYGARLAEARLMVDQLNKPK